METRYHLLSNLYAQYTRKTTKMHKALPLNGAADLVSSNVSQHDAERRKKKKHTHRKWRLNCVLQNTAQTCKLTILTKCVDVLNRRRSGAPKYDGCFSLERVHHGFTHYVRIATYKTIDNYTQSIRPAGGGQKRWWNMHFRE